METLVKSTYNRQRIEADCLYSQQVCVYTLRFACFFPLVFFSATNGSGASSIKCRVKSANALRISVCTVALIASKQSACRSIRFCNVIYIVEFSFYKSISARLCAASRKLVGRLVAINAAVAGDMLKCDDNSLTTCLDKLEEILIFDGRAARRLPVVSLPRVNPHCETFDLKIQKVCYITRKKLLFKAQSDICG